jgi:hypothetical protein
MSIISFFFFFLTQTKLIFFFETFYLQLDSSGHDFGFVLYPMPHDCFYHASFYFHDKGSLELLLFQPLVQSLLT